MVNVNNNQEKVLEFKDKGNECVKEAKYLEAVLHYSDAINLDKNNYQLYSNRSLAFLKLQQFHFALKDAQETVCLNPNWHKAHFRQAEVEFTTKNYAEALSSYRRAYQIQQSTTLLEYIIKTTKALETQQKSDQQIPWLYAAVFLILGVILVVVDATLPKTSVFKHPVIQVFVAISLSVCGLLLGRVYKWYSITQRKSLLDPPVDLLQSSESEEAGGEATPEETEIPEQTKSHPRYTKAQARHRFKKGKS